MVRGDPKERGLKGAWIKLARAVCVASFLVVPVFVHGADPAIKQLRIIALDSSARVAVVKIDDSKPQTWRVGETLALGEQHALLRDCAGNRAILEIAPRAGVAPMTVLLGAGEIYRLDVDRTPPRRVGVSAAASRAHR